MVVLQEKAAQKSSGNIIFGDASYDAVRKLTAIPDKETKREWIMILQLKKVRLVKYETSRRNAYLISGIYLIAYKLVQYRLVADNIRKKEEV